MGMKRKKRASRRRGWLLGSSATQVICISFVLLIALGTLLLTLPISSRSGRLGVVDAMFTATSATCVTGLVVRDTWTQFTPFGQAVVLLLIQVGGLGLVTLTSFFALAAKRRMGFKDLRLLGESVSASGYSQATDVLKIVVKLAMTFEIIGMVLLMIAFVPQFGAEGIWISAFTAISAFCNAGFDLFGRFGQYSSLAPYVSNYYVQTVIMFLIMAGGLGFMVWVEIGEWRKKRHLSLHARMVLLFSCILWVGGAVLIGLMEWNNPKSMGGLSVPGKVMAALFQSVSTRTAGMNTIDLAACGPITKLLMSVLQFIGAAPGSTGGGVKVTTFAVLVVFIVAFYLLCWSLIQRGRGLRQHVVGDGRRSARLNSCQRAVGLHREHRYGNGGIRSAALAADLGGHSVCTGGVRWHLGAGLGAARRAAARVACVGKSSVERLVHARDALLVVDDADGGEHHGQHHGHGGHVERDELDAQLLQHGRPALSEASSGAASATNR